ncbi:hypothetical protein SNE40_004542 [Patella caerulea]|uniref:Uncharacterized protein n=1 Tax=Patella caerulea TaxID=87958 RepID=A0AAN8K9P4_PATCE
MVLGALIGAALSCALGALWYAPVVFGNAWMSVTFPGKSARQIQASGSVGVSLGVSLLSSGTLALLMQCILVNFFKVDTLTEAASVGFGLACLSILCDISHCTFSQRSMVGFFIDHAYDAVCLVIMAVSIVYFNKLGLDIPIPVIGGSGKKSGL